DFAEERSESGDNWLHREAFEHSGPVWALLYETIVHVEIQMEQLASEIACAAAPGSIANLQAMNVSRIELCVDFATQSPHATYRALLPEFKRRYRLARFLDYGSGRTAMRYGEVNHDTESMRGYVQEGLSFKLYVKTNRRNRLEV